LTEEKHARMITVSFSVRQFQAIVHWRHKRGPAHCLARVHLPQTGTPLAIISEIRSNPDRQDIGSEFPTVADATLAALPPDAEVDPQAVIWVAHYGEFSSYDAYAAPEGFDRVMLAWDGAHYRGRSKDHHILKRDEAEELLAGVSLAPIPDVLRELGWTY
jgi:hypothetical protein